MFPHAESIPRGGIKVMKEGIHPKYYRAKVTCVTCGTTFEVGSTVPEIKVDTCSHCHSFYTGKLKFTADTGRIAKFNRLQAASKAKQAEVAADKKNK